MLRSLFLLYAEFQLVQCTAYTNIFILLTTRRWSILNMVDSSLKPDSLVIFEANSQNSEKCVIILTNNLVLSYR